MRRRKTDSDVCYVHLEETHNMDAPNEVVPIIMELFQPTSVVDFGCGTGTWLAAFQNAGIDELKGYEAEWLDPSNFIESVKKHLEIVDIENEVRATRKYDIAISLEVAEHLSESKADIFVDSLVNASDTILFSAAVPNQGGQNHVNEQPLSYWVSKFAERGYGFYDCIRHRIWENEEVFRWYRQNMVIFSRASLDVECAGPIDIIHPELLREKTEELDLHIQRFGLIKKLLRPVRNLFRRDCGDERGRI